jgi:hypothetical protein
MSEHRRRYSIGYGYAVEFIMDLGAVRPGETNVMGLSLRVESRDCPDQRQGSP